MNTKIPLILAAFAVAVPAFAQLPGFHSPVPPRSVYRKDVGLSFIKTEPPGSRYTSHSSPSSGMAAAVAISGTAAATLRMLEEATKKKRKPRSSSRRRRPVARSSFRPNCKSPPARP